MAWGTLYLQVSGPGKGTLSCVGPWYLVEKIIYVRSWFIKLKIDYFYYLDRIGNHVKIRIYKTCRNPHIASFLDDTIKSRK